jgi:PAS domain S-box-containing protein
MKNQSKEEQVHCASKHLLKTRTRENMYAILEHALDLLCVIDKKGRFVSVNSAAQRILGYHETELIGFCFANFIHKDDLAKTEALAPDFMAGKDIVNFENRYCRKDGSVVHLQWTAAWNEPDQLLYCVARDITELKKTQQALLASNDRFYYATKATSDAIWEWDVANDVFYFGEGYTALFGYETTESTLSGWSGTIHSTDRDRVLEQLMAVVFHSAESLWVSEYRFLKKDGAVAFVRNRCIVLRDNKGQPVRLVGALQDITLQKEHEHSLLALNRRLTEQTKKLKQSNRELENFAYVASHDLQEPLRSVSTFVQLLQKRYAEKLDEKARQYIGFVVEGASHMRQLIVNMLEYSRVDAASEPVVVLDVNDLIDQVIRIHRNDIAQTAAEITCKNLPVIRGRQSLLIQLFQNLIGNALKYRSASPPRITVGCREKKRHWLFYVKDNGIGIREEFYTKIFEMFQRLHARDEYSGTGIGLAICKKIVHLHGGEIRVKSVPGEGSTFLLTLQKNYD